jgi:hypothetical protein
MVYTFSEMKVKMVRRKGIGRMRKSLKICQVVIKMKMGRTKKKMKKTR